MVKYRKQRAGLLKDEDQLKLEIKSNSMPVGNLLSFNTDVGVDSHSAITKYDQNNVPQTCYKIKQMHE